MVSLAYVVSHFGFHSGPWGLDIVFVVEFEISIVQDKFYISFFEAQVYSSWLFFYPKSDGLFS